MSERSKSCPVWRHMAVALLGAACVLGAERANAEPIFGITLANQLIRFDSAAPDVVRTVGAVTGMGDGENILAIDVRPATGQLFGLGSASRLYTIDMTTAVATQVGTDGAFTLTGIGFGFDFDPTVDRIRVTSISDQNLQLNPSNSTLTGTDGTLAFSATDPNGRLNPNVTGSAYTNNVAPATTAMLYGIDSNLDILVTQSPANAGTLNTIGPLGVNANNLLAFDVSGTSGIAFASLNGLSSSSQLYTIDLTTGKATLLGDIGSTDLVRGIAAAPAAVSEPGTVLLVGTSALALLRRQRLGRRSEQ